MPEKLLERYGFNILESGTALDEDEAVKITSEIGFPVAMKIVSPDIIHKIEVGGVLVNVTSPEGARNSSSSLIKSRIVPRHDPGVTLCSGKTCSGSWPIRSTR